MQECRKKAHKTISLLIQTHLMEMEKGENYFPSLIFAIISILIQCNSYKEEFLFGFYVDSSVPSRDKSASFTKAGDQNMLEVHWAAYSLPLLEN